MSGWWRDTLFTRLFLLMLAALLGSHLVAWFVVTRVVLPMDPAAPARQAIRRLARRRIGLFRQAWNWRERPNPAARPARRSAA